MKLNNLNKLIDSTDEIYKVINLFYHLIMDDMSGDEIEVYGEDVKKIFDLLKEALEISSDMLMEIGKNKSIFSDISVAGILSGKSSSRLH